MRKCVLHYLHYMLGLPEESDIRNAAMKKNHNVVLSFPTLVNSRAFDASGR